MGAHPGTLWAGWGGSSSLRWDLMVDRAPGGTQKGQLEIWREIRPFVNLPLFPLSYTQLSGFLGQRRTGQEVALQPPQRGQHQEFGRQESHTRTQRTEESWNCESRRSLAGGCWVLGRRALPSGFGVAVRVTELPGRDLPASAPFTASRSEVLW